jgi:hypothetical protein
METGRHHPIKIKEEQQMSLSEYLNGTVPLSPLRGGGKYRCTSTCRMSVCLWARGKRQYWYAIIRLTDAAFEETGFEVNAPLYLHASENFLVIAAEGEGSPFHFKKDSNGRLTVSVNCAVLDPIVDLKFLQEKRTQPMEVLAVEPGLIKLKYPEKD